MPLEETLQMADAFIWGLGKHPLPPEDLAAPLENIGTSGRREVSAISSLSLGPAQCALLAEATSLPTLSKPLHDPCLQLY